MKGLQIHFQFMQKEVNIKISGKTLFTFIKIEKLRLSMFSDNPLCELVRNIIFFEIKNFLNNVFLIIYLVL